jgi:hypothetical protein
MAAPEPTMPCDAADDASALTSGVLTSPADGLLRDAIQTSLRADPHTRADRLEHALREIEELASRHPEQRPWTFSVYTGTDASRVFRGGTGQSLVVDPAGAIWRARSYEDFDTAYAIIGNECRITALTPHYEQMRRYELE